MRQTSLTNDSGNASRTGLTSLLVLITNNRPNNIDKHRAYISMVYALMCAASYYRYLKKKKEKENE